MQGRKARGGWNHCYVDGDVLGNRTSVQGTVHGLWPWKFLSPLYNMNSLLSIHSPCDAVWNILSCLWTRTRGPFSCVRLFGCWRSLACIRQLFPRKHHPRFTLLHCLLPLLLPDKKNWNPKLQSYHSCSKKFSATFLCLLLLTAPSPTSSVSLTADTPLSSLPASLHHLLANVASMCCPPLLLIRLGEASKTPRVAFKFGALFAGVRGCKSNHKRKSGGRGTAPVFSSLSHLCLCWDWGGKEWMPHQTWGVASSPLQGGCPQR